MSNFPGQLDDDVTLPPVNNNITEIGDTAVNALRDAVFNIEKEIGIGASGSAGSISSRLDISLDAAGNIKPSVIYALGLVTLPIMDAHIAPNAAILESKLQLDYGTTYLYNSLINVSSQVSALNGWLNISGSKVDPHINGTDFRHQLSHIDVTSVPANQLKNKFNILRDNTNSYTVLNDLNSDFVQHQKLDGTTITPQNVTTLGGSIYPSVYAHHAEGIYLNTNRFSIVPQTNESLQKFAEYIDSSSLFLIGSRIQNLYANGISRTSYSSTLLADGYGQFIVPPTAVTTYLGGNTGIINLPVDDIDNGDDIIEFFPTNTELTSNRFDEQFSLVKPGDIVTINYDGVTISVPIKEKKYSANGSSKKFAVRIAAKNIKYSTTATARINKSLVNKDKHGVLAVAASNHASVSPSLIVGSPRGASALGIGFDPQLFDKSHYKLYLSLFPTGKPEDGYINLPAIDVTGNAGANPGSYTLSSIVEATNNAFRQNAYNYRFIAFAHEGEFGIMLADPVGNASFSIISGVVNSSGIYDQASTTSAYPDNVVGLFGSGGKLGPDPLGFGPNGAAVASPCYLGTYASYQQAQVPTKLFVPLKKNNYYVGGVELEKFSYDYAQTVDANGDGYWEATILSHSISPSAVQTTYLINQDLRRSKLKAGKTLVVQSDGYGTYIDFGRFIISNVTFECGFTQTQITVLDAVHGTGVYPSTTAAVGSAVKIYFSSDSVDFNNESATDETGLGSTFKRHFEVFADKAGNIFTHERARFNISGSNISVNNGILYSSNNLINMNIVNMSPKLKGYKFTTSSGSLTKINLRINNYNATTGALDGYLCTFDGSNSTRIGTVTTGKVGEITRFYDETGVDFIDFLLDFNVAGSFTNANTDIQLFPSLQLDEEFFPLAVCQLNQQASNVSYVLDIRNFGNVSEKQLTSSALNIISAGDRYLQQNGVVRGFDLTEDSGNPINDQVRLKGGVALVNGNLLTVNNTVVSIPVIKEYYSSTDYNVNWALCLNDKGELQTIPLLDYDPVLGTPNAGNRVFVAKNPVTGLTYKIDALPFSTIVNKRKDLCILYVVASTVTGTLLSTSSTVSVTDSRRYANDVGSNLPLRYTSDVAQGNFINFAAVLNWLKYNNSFNGNVFLRGATLGTGSTSINFAYPVSIDGEGSSTITFSGALSISSGIVFRNINLVLNSSISVTASNVRFENCNITLNSGTFTISSASNVVFDGCTITSNISNSFSLTNTTNVIVKNTTITAGSIGSGNMFSISNATNTDFSNVSVTATASNSGNVFSISNSSVNDFYKCNFTGSYRKLFNISNTSSASTKFSLVNSNITSTHVATSDGDWTSSDLVNGSLGVIYSDVTNTLSDINIDNCSFTFAAPIGTPSLELANRLSFVTFKLSSASSVLKNVSITGCKFYNTLAGDDKRAVIAIVSNQLGSITGSTPLISNINITNNTCDKNQMVIVSGKLAGTIMSGPGMSASNCSIKDNNCGTVGYYVGTGRAIEGVNPISSINTTNNGLTISGNTCAYIAHLDNTGKYFVLSNVDASGNDIHNTEYGSGYVSVLNNSANWIHVGCGREFGSSLLIQANKLSGGNYSYLDDFNDNFIYLSSIKYTVNTSRYAIVISGRYSDDLYPGTQGEQNRSSVTVSNNFVSKGITQTSGGSPIEYSYAGYIFALTSVKIISNTLKGIDTTGTAYGIYLAGIYSHITNNEIYREGNDIYAYIILKYPFSTPFGSNTKSYHGIIVDNFFDSPYINGLNNDSLVFGIDFNTSQGHFMYERNKNQTGYASVMLNQDVTAVPSFSTGFAYNTPMGSYLVNSQTSSISSLLMRNTSVSSVYFMIDCPINISQYLPINVRVLNLLSGTSAIEDDGAFATDVDFKLGMSVGISKPTRFDPLSPATTLADVYYNYTSGDNGQDLPNPIHSATEIPITSPAQLATLKSATQYLNVPCTSDKLITGLNYDIYTKVYGKIGFSNIASGRLIFSPLIIKYRW